MQTLFPALYAVVELRGGGGPGGLSPSSCFKGPSSTIDFQGFGRGRKTALLEPQNGPLKVAKRPP